MQMWPESRFGPGCDVRRSPGQGAGRPVASAGNGP